MFGNIALGVVCGVVFTTGVISACRSFSGKDMNKKLSSVSMMIAPILMMVAGYNG